MMSELMATGVGPARLDMAYERLGDPDAPPVLLVMGLGAQLVGWPDDFCAALVAHGLQVIRFDNRDAGRSTHLRDAPVPDLAAILAGDLSTVTYTLSDMAADAAGLLDALGLPDAHVVGASVGGMIAQTMAIEHSDRVRSLTSLMSSTGDLSVGQPDPEALASLAGPPVTTRQEAIDRMVVAIRDFGSPGFARDEEGVRERAGRSYDRGHDDDGIARQAVAVLASGDRTAQLGSVTVPTLVVHGADDRMFDVSGGRATAAAIPGAELVVIDGMGHDLPPALWPDLSALIAEHVDRAEAARVG
jgi:pimeloyl-ACP methyl ester carboxylesterase